LQHKIALYEDMKAYEQLYALLFDPQDRRLLPPVLTVNRAIRSSAS
jgi:hypothetical protein